MQEMIPVSLDDRPIGFLARLIYAVFIGLACLLPVVIGTTILVSGFWSDVFMGDFDPSSIAKRAIASACVSGGAGWIIWSILTDAYAIRRTSLLIDVGRGRLAARSKLAFGRDIRTVVPLADLTGARLTRTEREGGVSVGLHLEQHDANPVEITITHPSDTGSLVALHALAGRLKSAAELAGRRLDLTVTTSDGG